MNFRHLDLYNSFITIRNEEEYEKAVKRFEDDLYDRGDRVPDFSKSKKWYVFVNHTYWVISVTMETWTIKSRQEVK